MRRLALLLLAGVFTATSGCFNPFSPLVGTQREVSTPAPVPSSAANVVRLFEWCWNNRGIQEYEEIFTDDFRFVFAVGDSAGVAYRDVPYTREDELNSAEGLFVGTADLTPASDITLDLDKTLISLGDDRPGKDPTWHRSIRTKVNLRVTLTRGDATELIEVNGFAKFFLVRGDSAVIPPELVARGFRPDPQRWWIERWEDETLPSGGGGAAQARVGPAAGPTAAKPDWPTSLVETTFGALKLKAR